MRFTLNNINNTHEGGKKWEKDARRAVILARFSIKGVNKINYSSAETSYTRVKLCYWRDAGNTL